MEQTNHSDTLPRRGLATKSLVTAALWISKTSWALNRGSIGIGGRWWKMGNSFCQYRKQFEIPWRIERSADVSKLFHSFMQRKSNIFKQIDHQKLLYLCMYVFYIILDNALLLLERTLEKNSTQRWVCLWQPGDKVRAVLVQQWRWPREHRNHFAG